MEQENLTQIKPEQDEAAEQFADSPNEEIKREEDYEDDDD